MSKTARSFLWLIVTLILYLFDKAYSLETSTSSLSTYPPLQDIRFSDEETLQNASRAIGNESINDDGVYSIVASVLQVLNTSYTNEYQPLTFSHILTRDNSNLPERNRVKGDVKTNSSESKNDRFPLKHFFDNTPLYEEFNLTAKNNDENAFVTQEDLQTTVFSSSRDIESRHNNSQHAESVKRKHNDIHFAHFLRDSHTPDFLVNPTKTIREITRDGMVPESFVITQHNYSTSRPPSLSHRTNVGNSDNFSGLSFIGSSHYLENNATNNSNVHEQPAPQYSSTTRPKTDVPDVSVELSLQRYYDTAFAADATNISSELPLVNNSKTLFGSQISDHLEDPISQYDASSYPEIDTVNVSEESVPKYSLTTAVTVSSKKQASEDDSTIDIVANVSDAQRKPKPQHNSNTSTDYFVVNISGIHRKIPRPHNFTSSLRKEVLIDPRNLAWQQSSTSNITLDTSIKIRQQNNSKSDLTQAISSVTAKPAYHHESTSHHTRNASNVSQKPVPDYISMTHIRVNNSIVRKKQSLKHKIQWFPLFKSPTAFSDQSSNFSYPLEINDTQPLSNKQVFGNAGDKFFFKRNPTVNNTFGVFTLENQAIQNANETTPFLDASLNPLIKSIKEVKPEPLEVDSKLSDWYKKNRNMFQFFDKNKSHFPTTSFPTMVNTEEQLHNTSLSEDNFALKEVLTKTLKLPNKNLKKNFDKIDQFSTLASESKPGESSSMHLQKKKQKYSIRLLKTSTFDQQLNDLPWDIEPITSSLNLEHQQENINSTENNTVQIEKDNSVENQSEWEKSKNMLGIAWELHVYVTGSSFGLLALYSFVSILKLGTYEKLLSRGYFISISLMLFVMGIIRALYLLFDPYNTQGFYPPVLNNFIFNSGFLCATSAFGVLSLALLQITQVDILPQHVQSPIFLSGVTIFQFAFSFTTDVLQGFGLGETLLLLIFQATQLLWALTLALGYIYAFRKLYKSAVKKQSEMIRVAFTRLHIDGAQLPKKLPKPTLCLAVRSTVIIALFGLLMVALRVFGIIYIDGIFEAKPPTSWTWWGYQLGSRIVELLLCFTICFIATLPMKRFESKQQKCRKYLLWVPCNTSCSRSEEVESEIFPIYFPNYQGQPNVAFHTTSLERPRRWNHTTSLPTIPTFTKELDSGFQLKRVPTDNNGLDEQTNSNASNILSFESSKHPASKNVTNDLNGELQRPVATQGKLTEENSTSSSMLYIDQGYIRFRTITDPEQPPIQLTDGDSSEEDNCHDENESTRAHAGSSVHTLYEEDVFQSSLSPFFQAGFYQSRLKRMSHWSLDTTDNSMELSPEQLSNVTSKNGFSSSALDFTPRKQGSTCSSESAANSFDVTFFLNRSAGDSAVISQAIFGEIDEDKASNVDIPHNMARSVSPIAASARRNHDFQLNLDLPCSSGVGQVNVACGTEDITPDSAVYLDLQLSQESSCKPRNDFLLETHERKSSCSQSMTGIDKSRTIVLSSKEKSTTKINFRELFDRFKGSTFSLNTNFSGYEPLETETLSPRKGELQPARQLKRSNSDKGPTLNENHAYFSSFGVLKKDHFINMEQLHQGDSGLLKDSPEISSQVDQACQTEPVFIKEQRSDRRIRADREQCKRPALRNIQIVV
ncbi:uncharacterized protein LOC106466502 [Limulus polyphemus]|uniref:Uncharacterized protein LOC106466502 n=1 Tax=Limulus polyphemus TaxID=6850 RepID=A0ABM1BHR4_LIMPO|nr:uncharacterized protein LOC106466502 [Limulus polyphemus]